MRTKVTLVLVFLNVALFFFIFKFERNWRTEAASMEARRRVLGSEAADIRWLEVANTATSTTYSLTRQREQWMLTKPLNWPANPHAADNIVSELQLLEHETSFPTRDLGKNGNPTLADYGLDQPKLTVTFRSGDPTNISTPATVLRIGDTAKGGARLYVLSPDGERVHVVNRSLADSLSLPLEKLRTDKLFTIEVFEARSLGIILGNSETRANTGPMRIWLRTDNRRWVFDSPISARASKLAIDNTINDLKALEAKTFNPPAPATPPSVAPTLRVTLEGNNRHETLFLGEPVRPTPAPAGAAPAPLAPTPGASSTSARPEPTTEYYAQLENRDAVFTVVVPDRLVSNLRNSLVDLREKRLLDFDPRSVSAVILSSPLTGQPAVTLQRLENTTGAESAWQVRRGENAQGPQTQAADPDLVQRLLLQLASLTALRFESDAPSSADLENWGLIRPIREVTLNFSGNTTATGGANAQPTFRFGTSANREVYARVATPTDPGDAIYALPPEILRDLPLDPIAWRHRLVQELPATTRIAGLKLTDLVRNQVLLEATLDAAGQPVTPVPAPEALKSLLAQLRKLQARRFVQGNFTERISLGGNELAWRFQLDVTLAPPAAGAEQTRVTTWFFTERGPQQLGGSKDIDAIFEIEQPLIDALWPLTEGARDPGPPPAPKQ